MNVARVPHSSTHYTMKSLVYWCRWHEAKLRLRGRDPHAIWGELVYTDHAEPFHFDLQHNILTHGKGEQQQQVLLDDMGVEKHVGS